MRFGKLLFFILIIMGGAIAASPVLAAGRLVKISSMPTVYYLDGQNVRHVFPTAAVYKTWYDDFSRVEIISREEIIKYPLGENIRVRAGVNIVKFQTGDDYYAVEPGGVLRRFEDRELAEEMYGEYWQNRLVILPDAFFGDYILGSEITRRYHLPDGILIKLSLDNKYYLKLNDLFWPFQDWSAAEANGFKRTDVVASDITLESRVSKISGLSYKIFNPAESRKLPNADCEHKNFKIAFIMVSKEQPTVEEIKKLANIKDQAIENFTWATHGLAKIDASYPAVILKDNPDLFFNDIDGQNKPANEAINIFFDDHPDVFDFVVLYNNFVIDEPEIAKYLMLTNHFKGTGNGQLRSSYIFGSRGKLKGILNMGNIDKYSIDSQDALNVSANYILHELAHHFSGRAKFINAEGKLDSSLLRRPDLAHWDMYTNMISPLGGSGWEDKGDGIYTNKLSLSNQINHHYSDLDLYFMGLLPKYAIDPIGYLVPDPGQDGNTIAGTMKQVTIDQIVEAMGEWSCSLN